MFKIRAFARIAAREGMPQAAISAGSLPICEMRASSCADAWAQTKSAELGALRFGVLRKGKAANL